ncbi:MAG: alpha/beta fold hydrolase [Hyphomicrobiaceae bacterium]
MPTITSFDGTKLYYEEAGEGTPVVFVHEYAGDYRSWEPQLRHLSRSHRCITFSARGYPPSDVPEGAEKYSQDIARRDVVALMDALRVKKAHVVGHSMGAYTTLHVGIHDPERCLSLVAAGCGWGSNPAERDASKVLVHDIARMFREDGIEVAAAKYADFPMRHAYKYKDPRGWTEFAAMLADHSGIGSALTMLRVQLERPTLWELEEPLKALQVPLLVIVGDEDDACLDGSVFVKRKAPQAALLVVPRASHTIPSEEPDVFNRALAELFASVEAGRWLAHRAPSAG